MSFPVGEQFFIDAVRGGHRALPGDLQAAFDAEVRGFVGQEATHRRIHALFNAQIEKHGLHNAWADRARQRLALLQGTDPRHALAITAANEHFTALFADWMLRHPALFGTTEPRLQTLWLWHSAEESEHKNTAFDLYRALGGNEAWRRTWFRRITLIFLGDLRRQTVDNLRRDGSLWKWRTWRSAAGFLFGRQGLLSSNFGAWRAYLRADFHPGQQHSRLAADWLAAHSDQYTVVGAQAAA